MENLPRDIQDVLAAVHQARVRNEKRNLLYTASDVGDHYYPTSLLVSDGGHDNQRSNRLLPPYPESRSSVHSCAPSIWSRPPTSVHVQDNAPFIRTSRTASILPCEFASYTGCAAIFFADSVEVWINHIMNQHLRLALPEKTRCWFCDDVTFESESPSLPHKEAAFKARMLHIAQHISQGCTLDSMRPDFYFIEHLYRVGLLSDTQYRHALRYRESSLPESVGRVIRRRPPPAVTGVMPAGFPEAERSVGRRMRQHDNPPRQQIPSKAVDHATKSWIKPVEFDSTSSPNTSGYSLSTAAQLRGAVSVVIERSRPHRMRQHDNPTHQQVPSQIVEDDNTGNSIEPTQSDVSRSLDTSRNSTTLNPTITNRSDGIYQDNSESKPNLGNIISNSNKRSIRTSESRSSLTTSSSTLETLSPSLEGLEEMELSSHFEPQDMDTTLNGILNLFAVSRGANDFITYCANFEQNQTSAPSTPVDKGKGRVRAYRPLKRRISDENNNEEGDDEDDEGGNDKKKHRNQKLGNNKKGRLLACPFYKWKPNTHASCKGYTLREIYRVKDHLWRKHLSPISCVICCAEFETVGERDKHTRALACKLAKPKDWGAFTGEQREKLKKPADRKKTQYEQWYEIYVILFPNSPLPSSPYLVEGLLADQLSALRDYMSEHCLPEYDEYARRFLPVELQGNRDMMRAYVSRFFEQAVEKFMRKWELRSVGTTVTDPSSHAEPEPDPVSKDDTNIDGGPSESIIIDRGGLEAINWLPSDQEELVWHMQQDFEEELPQHRELPDLDLWLEKENNYLQNPIAESDGDV